MQNIKNIAYDNKYAHRIRKQENKQHVLFGEKNKDCISLREQYMKVGTTRIRVGDIFTTKS